MTSSEATALCALINHILPKDFAACVDVNHEAYVVTLCSQTRSADFDSVEELVEFLKDSGVIV